MTPNRTVFRLDQQPGRAHPGASATQAGYTGQGLFGRLTCERLDERADRSAEAPREMSQIGRDQDDGEVMTRNALVQL